MKTQNQVKSGMTANQAAGFRASGVRTNHAKTFEHRYERRKIREQLRRLDWALAGDE